MDIPTIPGAVYTISSTSSCDVTDKATGKYLGTATSGAPFSTPAYSDALTLSDPDALYVQIKTFNYALAALGLLGGGDSFPAGYIRAEFLESTGSQIIQLGVTPSDDLGGNLEYEDFYANTDAPMLSAERADKFMPRFYFPYSYNGTCYIGWDTWDIIGHGSNKNLRTTATLNFFNDRKYKMVFGQDVFEGLLTKPLPTTLYGQPLLLFCYINDTVRRYITGRVFSLVLTQNKTVVRRFFPAISKTGEPCIYDLISKQSLTNSGTGEFVVGFTLPQARNLRKLPEGGGELTISLPSNWQEDTAVVDALATAESKGWVLTIQTYEAEAGAVSTFALRRIWVRKRAEQNGSYVATDGTRWQIDWCATMVGGDPQEYGYEPFRSVEAAAAYWELEPYVDPEQEQLLTD